MGIASGLINYLKGFPIQPVQPENDYRLINSVKLLVNGNQILPSMLQLIRKAKSSILFQVMLFHPDSAGKAISTELINAVRRGVQIRLMFSHEMSVSGSIAGRFPQKKTNEFKKSLAEMTEDWAINGIEVIDNRAGLPSQTYSMEKNSTKLERELRRSIQINANHVDHRKFIIIDGAVAIVGGANVGEEYLYLNPPDFSQNMVEAAKSRIENSDPEPWEKWLDTAIKFKGGLISLLIEEFQFRWEMLGGESFKVSSSDNGMAGNRARVLSQRPGHHEISAELLRLFNLAQKTINVACPFVSHPQLINAFSEAASRGVDVNFVYPGKYNDMEISRRIINYYIRDIYNAGVNIYENNTRMVHTKVITVDSKISMVGSANLNFRSAIHDFELNLLVEDEKLTKEINRRVFDNYFRSADLLEEPESQKLSSLDWAVLPFS